MAGGSWQSKLNAAVVAVEAAPFARERWHHALELVAPLVGGNASQIIGWTGSSDIPLNTTVNITSDELQLWFDLGGADPNKNPLIRRGIRTPAMQIVSDEEVISSRERGIHPLWAEFYSVVDIPHFAFLHLESAPRSFLTLGVMHGRTHGPITKGERQAFSLIAQKWLSSVSVSRSIGAHGSALIKGALESVGAAAVVLDGFGQVVGITERAEMMVKEGGPFTVVGRRLQFSTFALDMEVKAQINLCIGRRCHRAMTIAIQGTKANKVKYGLNLTHLPNELNDIGFGAAALIVIEELKEHPGERLRQWLEQILTPAEYSIAIDLLAGHRLEDIIERRGVSIQTLRSQAKAIYAKSNSSGRIEFMAKFSAVLGT